MYAWVLPTVKAILPHVGTIVAAAQPMFKKRKVDQTVREDERVIQEQILELQDAASQNAANIHELAEQLQQTVLTLERAALESERRYRRLSMFSGVALVCSLVAVGVALSV